MNRWNMQLYFNDVTLGIELPSVSIPLSIQRLVMEAGANRDFSSIHHDIAAARETGAPNVYTNYLFILGMFERLLREWIGLKGEIKRIGPLRMKIFNCVGDFVTYKGRVREKREEKGKGVILLDVWSETHRGLTVTGEAAVVLPKRAA